MYNSHGQVVAAARVDGKTETIGYDANDHATTIDDGTTTIVETLAPGGRVLERKVTNDTSHAVTEDTVYGYAGSSDNPAYTRAAAGGSVTSYVGACVDIAGTATWEIRNGHGDVVGTTDAAGAYTVNPPTDEFGVGTTPATRLGYLGGAERFTTDNALGIIRMGVRLYDPTLGRFLQVDPIPGGSANKYDYVKQDPINGLDLGGDISFCSDDFCCAAQAQLQARNDESPLERSSDFYNTNQDLRQRNKIDSMRTYGKTSWLHAGVTEVKVLGAGATVVLFGAALGATAPTDLEAVGYIDTGLAAEGGLATCNEAGWTSRKCGNAAVTFAVGALIGKGATDAETRLGRATWAFAGVAWNYLRSTDRP